MLTIRIDLNNCFVYIINLEVEKPKDKLLYSNNMVVDNNSPDRVNQGKTISKNRK